LGRVSQLKKTIGKGEEKKKIDPQKGKIIGAADGKRQNRGGLGDIYRLRPSMALWHELISNGSSIDQG